MGAFLSYRCIIISKAATTIFEGANVQKPNDTPLKLPKKKLTYDQRQVREDKTNNTVASVSS